MILKFYATFSLVARTSNHTIVNILSIFENLFNRYWLTHLFGTRFSFGLFFGGSFALLFFLLWLFGIGFRV